jgi:hypothetical protein
MSDIVKKFIVEAGCRLKLRDINPDHHGKHEPHEAALPEIQAHLQKLDQLQYLMYAEEKHALLIVLDGLDGVARMASYGMPVPA